MFSDRKITQLQFGKDHDTVTYEPFSMPGVEAEVDGISESGLILTLACQDGFLPAVQQMLAQGANPDEIRFDECTPIYLATANGHADVVTCLLDHKVNPNTYNAAKACTPLHVACQEGHNDIALALVEHKADVNAVDVDLCTPLVYAILNNNNEGVSLLIARGANLNVLDKLQCTPLLNAIRAGNLVAVELLLQAGAAMEVEGQLIGPMDAAKIGHKDDIAVYLAACSAVQKLRKNNAAHEAEDLVVSCRTVSGKLLEHGFRMFTRKRADETLKTSQELVEEPVREPFYVEYSSGTAAKPSL